ncbi:hypothetical protein DOTSEDRAFT_70286 [Dothistroma septosporum NZE10]|uniref:Uncharacterized protein n=1 Tax=Dothistroma septosporum (strain NZE10 / CBS 128990) TaxID=675120 RepID=N1PV50_DOTSN|nr:hypothetical protein DOTSEDRAFT_70286 [Dothistroma septosporum NZE10]
MPKLIVVAVSLRHDRQREGADFACDRWCPGRSICSCSERQRQAYRAYIFVRLRERIGRSLGPLFAYTAKYWNPMTGEEAIAAKLNAVVAYCGSKTFDELEAWFFIDREKPRSDLVAFCPPVTLGPISHSVSQPAQLNESNDRLWDIAISRPVSGSSSACLD